MCMRTGILLCGDSQPGRVRKQRLALRWPLPAAAAKGDGLRDVVLVSVLIRLLAHGQRLLLLLPVVQPLELLARPLPACSWPIEVQRDSMACGVDASLGCRTWHAALCWHDETMLPGSL